MRTLKTFNQLFESLSDDFDKLVIELQAKKVPCKVRLQEFGGREEIEVLCGFDYPDSIADKIFTAAEKLGIKEPSVSADSSGGTIKRSTNVAGGPKRY